MHNVLLPVSHRTLFIFPTKSDTAPASKDPPHDVYQPPHRRPEEQYKPWRCDDRENRPPEQSRDTYQQYGPGYERPYNEGRREHPNNRDNRPPEQSRDNYQRPGPGYERPYTQDRYDHPDDRPFQQPSASRGNYQRSGHGERPYNTPYTSKRKDVRDTRSSEQSSASRDTRSVPAKAYKTPHTSSRLNFNWRTQQQPSSQKTSPQKASTPSKFVAATSASESSKKRHFQKVSMSSERGSRKRNIDIGDNTSFPQWFSDPKNDDEEPEREKDLEEEKVQPSAPLTLSALMSSLWDEIKKNQETAMGNFGGYNADVLDLEPIRTDAWYTDATVDALIGIVLEANPGRGISFIANMYIRPCLVPFDAAAQHSRCMLSVSSAVYKRRWRTKMNSPQSETSATQPHQSSSS